MTAQIDHLQVARLARSDAPRALAFVRDASRRGAVRVVRVAVVQDWPALRAAAVAELKTGAQHILPHRRLAPPPSPNSKPAPSTFFPTGDSRRPTPAAP